MRMIVSQALVKEFSVLSWLVVPAEKEVTVSKYFLRLTFAR
jgi:hypothetical protein